MLTAALTATGCGSGGSRPADGSPQDPLPHLAPGVRQVGFLAGGETHRYVVKLPARSHARLRIEVGWLPELEAGVTGPRGESVLAASSIHHWPSYSRALTTRRGGRHLVEIRAGEEGPPDAGRYALQVVEVRPTRASDADLLRAETAFAAVMAAPEYTPSSFAESEALYRRAGSTAGLAAVALERGLLHKMAGASKEALEELRRAAELYRQAGDSYWQGYAETSIARVYDDLATDAQESALPHYRRALELIQSGDPYFIGLTEYRLAQLLRGESLVPARDGYRAALARFEEAADRCNQIQALVGLGTTERPLGELDRAAGHYERAAELLRDRRCPQRVADSFRINRAVLERYRGTPQAALDGLRDLEAELEDRYRQQCAKRTTRSSDCRELARGLKNLRVNLGFVLSDLGRLEAALEQHERAFEWSGDPWPLVAKGWALLELDRLAEAEAELQAAWTASQAAPGYVEAFAVHGLGVIASRQGRREEARQLLEQALDLHRSRGSKPGEISALQDLGKLHLDSGELDTAGGRIAQAVAVSDALQDPERQAASLALQAQLQRREGLLHAARGSYGKALRLREEQRTAIEETDLRVSFVARWGEIYQEFVDLLMELHALWPERGHDVEAFEISERARARSLAELLRDAEIDVLARIDDELVDRHRAARTRVLGLSYRLANLDRSGLDPAAAERDRREIPQARRELRRLEVTIAARYPQYSDLVAPPAPSLSATQAELAEGDVLLEYSLGRPGSILFVVTRHDFAALPLRISADEVARLVEESLPPAVPGQADRTAREASAELYRRLIAPAQQRLASAGRLLIVPDGALHRLPFEMLRPPPASGAGPGYLLERWEVAYAPSAVVLQLLPRSAPPDVSGLDFVAFAPRFGGPLVAQAQRGGQAMPDLVHAREEVASIARAVYAESSRLYLEDEARESRVKGDPVVHRARRLHFATHGLAGERAEQLGLLLAESVAEIPGVAEDGRLGLDEIFELDLDADLVVLSACETARGEQAAVEGLVGFGRAFFAAGASSVVASLWKVDDRSTARLMEVFYQELNAGATKSAALRTAKLRLIEQNLGRPYLWAPFVLLGQPD